MPIGVRQQLWQMFGQMSDRTTETVLGFIPLQTGLVLPWLDGGIPSPPTM